MVNVRFRWQVAAPHKDFVIASAAKQSRAVYAALDCFAALAITMGVCLLHHLGTDLSMPYRANR